MCRARHGGCGSGRGSTEGLAVGGQALRMQPARVVSVKQPPRGQAVVAIECLGPDGNVSQKKDELIGSLRAEPRSLPPRR